MKKYLPHIFIVALLLGWAGVFGMEVVQAMEEGVITSVGVEAFQSVVEGIGNIVLQFMAFFVYISGYLLDYSLSWTLNIANLVGNITAIETGWKVFRDLCTMFFIFILLYTAITTILGGELGGKENAKKVLTTVIIAGLLINFSLFFTKIIIDASNVVSLGFYKALVPTPDTDISLGKVIGVGTNGLSAIFMNSLYLQTAYDPSGLKTITNDQVRGSAATAGFGPADFGRRMVNIVMGSIVMLIASIVFLAASFFFMVRIVMLLLLMVTSPIAFAGKALGGKLEAKANDWWKALIDQCLFMPAYLAITYVGVKIIASPGFQNAINPTNGSISAVAGGGTVGVIFNYCVVIIFLMAALIIAKEFGVLGAATFNGWAKNVGLALPRLMGSGGKAFGSMVGKNTLGRAGAYLDKNAGNTWAGNTGLGRAFREGTYGALAKAKFGGERSFKDEKDRNKENDAKKRQIADNATIKAGAQMDAMVKARGTTASDAEQKVIDDGAIALQKMSASDITTQSPKMLAENAKNLNEGQIKAIIKSDKITDADKENVMKARFAPIDEALAIMSGSGSAADKAAAKTSLEDAVTHLTDTDIENLGYERLKNDNLIAALPYSKIKIATDKKAEGYSPDQKKAFKEAKLAPLLKEIADQNSSGAPAGPNPAIKDKLDKLKLGSEDIASLGKSTLVQLAKFGSLPLSAMSKISESIGSMSERKEIKNAIAESCTDVALKNYLLTDTPLPGLHTFAGNHREESIHKFFDKNPVGMMFDK